MSILLHCHWNSLPCGTTACSTTSCSTRTRPAPAANTRRRAGVRNARGVRVQCGVSAAAAVAGVLGMAATVSRLRPRAPGGVPSELRVQVQEACRHCCVDAACLHQSLGGGWAPPTADWRCVPHAMREKVEGSREEGGKAGSLRTPERVGDSCRALGRPEHHRASLHATARRQPLPIVAKGDAWT